MRKYLAVAAAVGLMRAFPAAVMAHSGGADTYVAQLSELNGSGTSGTAQVTLEGDQLTVLVGAAGLLAEKPHAQHIHDPNLEGGAIVEGACPNGDADADDDGFISTSEGHPAHGMIATSLTTEGDSSPDSALAVERCPTAPGGAESYSRTFTVPDGFDAAQDLPGVGHRRARHRCQR